MSRWLLTRRDGQSSADGLEELVRLASEGQLSEGDLVQPPGTSEWLYAVEVPDLQGIVRPADKDDDDVEWRRSGLGGSALSLILGGVLIGVAVLGLGLSALFYSMLPDGEATVLGGKEGLKYSEVLTTQPTALLSEAGSSGREVMKLPQNQRLELLSKRGGYYRVNVDGKDGWVAYADVLPAYQLTDSNDVGDAYDPLYNPDQYVKVVNGTYTKVTSEDEDEEAVATIDLQIENKSQYQMTNFIVTAVVVDSRGNEIETREFAIEGVVPAGERAMVGMLHSDLPEELEKLEKEGEEIPPAVAMFDWAMTDKAKSDPEIEGRWTWGLDVPVYEEEFVQVIIRMAELHAIPDPSVTAAVDG